MNANRLPSTRGAESARVCRRVTLVLLISGVAVGCNSATPPDVPEDWQTIRARTAFTFKAPPDLEQEVAQGVDSFVGRYVSPTLKLSFDFGWYSNAMDGEGYTASWTRIDGRRARIVRTGDVMGVHFPELGADTKLTMRVELHGADPALVETIFRTIDFPEESAESKKRRRHKR